MCVTTMGSYNMERMYIVYLIFSPLLHTSVYSTYSLALVESTFTERKSEAYIVIKF